MHPGGETALVLYTLLHVGQSMDDPRLRWNSTDLAPVVKIVNDMPALTNYLACFKALGLSLTPVRAETKRALSECRETILRCTKPDGSVTYDPNYLYKNPRSWDNSNAQYALLALWALDDVGVEIPLEVWRRADGYWRGNQKVDGGWPYDTKWRPNSNAPMDAAGLASLYITLDETIPSYAVPPLTPRQDAPMAAALAKVTTEFTPQSNDYYYLYCCERVGLASGLKFFNEVNWYTRAAESITAAQGGDGRWTGMFVDKNLGGENPIVCTCYALLILARGRNPVMFNKLEYGDKDSRWNARPRDDAYLTHWMSKQFEKPLNWQVVNTKVNAEEWFDAPILLITGSQDPKFTDADIAKLKTFVEAGGTIFSTADGADKEFTEAIKKKYAPALVDRKYEMQDLLPTDPLFDAQLWTKIASPPPMMGLSNGVRQLWIHSTVDMGASWQNRKVATQEHFFIPANLQRYATGKGSLRNKLQSIIVPPATEGSNRSLTLARLDYAGNPDPEPGAWRRFAKLAAYRFHTTLTVTTVKIADLDPAKYPIVHMTGTTSFTLTDDEIAALKKYINGGGLLFADSAGGSAKFAAAFTELAAKLVPDKPLAAIPANDRLYNGSIDESIQLDDADYRKFTVATRGRSSTLRLQAATRDGRHMIIFSEDDVTSGLLGTDTWGISGYTPDYACSLARNILLYSAAK